MTDVRFKSRRVRLDPESYCELQRQVLERDGWRCQFCGSMQRLQVHHLKFRSQSGGDEEQNLITLCAQCHACIHSKTNLHTAKGL
jgi:5-methylcytosine-specific restriction endonuclease McrA